ncbi:MAG: chromosome segregation protein SMC [Candidatus Rokubacteria bacterium]|nr:chromosome segregation protein SMC [Candidatus Rokubacteria bacterium]
MRLEQIVIQGFKSFVEKTEVQVFPGVTCIVGPNGCGKSNVADAVRWALGEQSPKILRGHKMEDVIFHGSSTRKAVGLAEVGLVFNNDGGLNVPWSEVGVARRLYRTGESEYLLNKSVCRLRDIQDLFAGTGVNPKAYALMDQDRLNHVLTAKPWERRIFIEEAAGVARYKQQRAETQGKLDATRQNLQRVRDVMDEVKRQVSSLERQAKKAQQYKALHQERQALDLAMLAADYAGLTAAHEALVQEGARLRREEDERRVAIAQIEAREATLRAAIQESEYRLADLRQSAQKFQGEVERLLERREQMGAQIREMGEEELRLGEEIRSLTERRTDVGAKLQDAIRALGDARERFVGLDRQVREFDVDLEMRRSELGRRREAVEALRLEQIRVAGDRAELTRSAGELRERGAQLERRRERLEAETTSARGEADALAAAQRHLETSIERTGVQLSLLTGEREQVEQELVRQGAMRVQAQESLAALRVAIVAKESAREALGRLEREREGYGAGVRSLFSPQAASSVAGVVGTVADLLEVPPGLEPAVEAVLGDRLQWVIVERFEHARAALTYLEREGAGAATLLALETLAPARSAGEGGSDDKDVTWADRLVGGPRPELVRHLLGGVGVVGHLDLAEALWRRDGAVATYVTRAGEVLAPTGALTGGRRHNERQANDHSLLGRKRALRQLSEELGELALQAEEAQRRFHALDREVESLRGRQEVLQVSVHAQETARLSGEKDIEAARREALRVLRHLETLQAEGRQLSGEASMAAREIEALDERLAEVAARETAIEREMTALRQSLEADQAGEASIVVAATSCRVNLATVLERVEALGREIDSLSELEVEFGARLEEAGSRRAQILDRRQDLTREQGRTDERAREVGAERDRKERDVAVLAEEHSQRLDLRQTAENELRESQRRLDGLVSRIHEVDLKETEGRVRREELLQEAGRRHAVDGAETLLAAHDPTRDLEAGKIRYEELGARLEGMGPVNLVADDEYRELQERLEFLRSQHDDLVQSMKDLDRALRGMTRTAQERFQEAFEEINRHFGEIFQRLFEGGRAELRMVPPEEGEDDPLELGVELMAQPRGKRLQAVTLMSGGERALTGLALLFAIFYYRPSPFCVLDEVDAPLDDANIHRFIRVLRELCSQTQFIVITHNRKTMEAADVLYGVTMQEPGLSRLVSVKLTEA